MEEEDSFYLLVVVVRILNQKVNFKYKYFVLLFCKLYCILIIFGQCICEFYQVEVWGLIFIILVFKIISGVCKCLVYVGCLRDDLKIKIICVDVFILRYVFNCYLKL